MKRRKLKKSFKILFIIFALIVVLLVGLLIYYRYTPNKITNIKSIIEDKKIIIKYDLLSYKKDNVVYVAYTTDEKVPDRSAKWVKCKSTCELDLIEDTMYIYLKDSSGNIYYVNDSSEKGFILNLKMNKEKIYLAVDSTYKLKIEFQQLGNIDKKIVWNSENTEIAKVDENGTVTGVSAGTTKIIAKINGEEVVAEVIVTSLITKRPTTYDRSKSYVPCGIYSKDDNDLMDVILEDRISDAGYQTRAGVVEAARFLTLDFPYKIRYFSENGRLTLDGTDGEGRYYHKGMYLHSSRFEYISKSMYGPNPWGCQIYSFPAEGMRPNGLDCSGFVSWVLLNGGFDVGDLGAGTGVTLDLTDFGERVRITPELLASNKIKVGDLLSEGGEAGGHIAILVGEDDENYYVAESLWTYPTIGVFIMTYKKTTFYNNFYFVMLMDSYYKVDGNLTNMWY